MLAIVYIKIDLRRNPDEFSIRKWRRICKGAMEAVGRWWHGKMLPKHFEPSARGRYGYQPRSARYDKLKHIQGIHADLVGPTNKEHQGGEMRRQTMTIVEFRAFPTRMTVVVHGPAYLTPNPTGKRAGHPNMARELTAYAAGEKEELTKIAAEEMERQKVLVRGETAIDWFQGYRY
jgi:hypothetical protein